MKDNFEMKCMFLNMNFCDVGSRTENTISIVKFK